MTAGVVLTDGRAQVGTPPSACFAERRFSRVGVRFGAKKGFCAPFPRACELVLRPGRRAPACAPLYVVAKAVCTQVARDVGLSFLSLGLAPGKPGSPVLSPESVKAQCHFFKYVTECTPRPIWAWASLGGTIVHYSCISGMVPRLVRCFCLFENQCLSRYLSTSSASSDVFARGGS